ncbi:putative RNA methyltransferase [Carex littledalei]|uniref:RNA methyltransferase n=1 Tax=Carex littledalei TaxID=544730 RepID=A0A833RHN4_9POAL|nr:putative RNA methyltransferase [Carex littledalei]
MATEPTKEENGASSKGKSTSHKKRKEKDVFIYGNYKSYYGYRIDRNTKEDPRLAVFKKEWFEGKDCLDIGCNQGIVTIAIAKKFKCRSIVGIDIDGGLIESAHWNLRKASRQVNSNKAQIKGFSDNADNSLSKDEPNVDEEMDLSKVVSFHRENFVEYLHVSSEKYDAIVCLSVSKWIHLNWGDEGIITLFVKIWRLLRPGGVFLLEPQPWKSYKQNRLVSETAKANFERIFLHPGKFREILLDKIGFRSAEVITDKLTGTVAGFDRPITAFYK